MKSNAARVAAVKTSGAFNQSLATREIGTFPTCAEATSGSASAATTDPASAVALQRRLTGRAQRSGSRRRAEERAIYPLFVLGGAVVVALLGALGGGAPIPTPIGVGPQFRIPAAPQRVLQGAPVGRFRCAASPAARVQAHVELFANRRVLLLPAGVGMAPPLKRVGAYVVRSRCSYGVRTRAPTGVVEAAR